MKKKLKNIVRILWYLNFKTIVFNFKYFKLSEAFLFPVFISDNVLLRQMKGNVEILGDKLETGMIRIGYGNVGIFDKKKSRAIWEVSGKVIFKGETNIGHGSKIIVAEVANLIFGERFTISAESTIVCFHKIEFGSDCLLSWDILAMDTDFHKIYSLESREQLNKNEEIIIGDKCWIGCRSLILKGALLPDNTVLAANSLVTNNKKSKMPSNSILGGTPLKVLKEGVFWTK